MNCVSILNRSSQVLREEGVRGLWFKTLGETVYRRLLLLERPLHDPILEVPTRVPVVIGLLKQTEIAEYLEFRRDTTLAELHSQLDAGHWCFVARYEGRLVCARWAGKDPVWIEYLARELRLEPDEVYSYGLFTSPDYRGAAISPAASTAMLRHFRAAGFRRVVAAISPENHASLRSVFKTGYRPYGLMGYVKIGPWRWDFCRCRVGSKDGRSTR